jgi:hypothetical protein
MRFVLCRRSRDFGCTYVRLVEWYLSFHARRHSEGLSCGLMIILLYESVSLVSDLVRSFVCSKPPPVEPIRDRT